MQFAFPLKQKLDKSFRNYLQSDYDVEQTVLNEKQLDLVIRYNNKTNPDTRPGKLMRDDETIHPTITACMGKAKGRSGVFKCKEGHRIITSLEAWRLMRI